MQFDHRDPMQKTFELGCLQKSYSIKKIQAEIDKCDVICANCHCERTHAGQHWKIRRNGIVQPVQENPQGELPLADLAHSPTAPNKKRS
jgi:hypothetical protein